MKPDPGHVSNISCNFGGDLMLRTGKVYLYPKFTIKPMAKTDAKMKELGSNGTLGVGGEDKTNFTS